MEEEGGATTEIRSPQLFGEYEVIKSIGKGKFAVVYRARKLGSEEAVALKKISVDMMDSKAREKCLKEVRLLQSLDHPNIIHYLDSFITENDLVIVYEWAAAGDLKRQLRKAQERGSGFEERIIWKYFSQISNAMQHMHERRIMHRDLKPANIFLTLDGTIKVGDLGLSRELSEHTVQAHSKVGTPLYMSPEVLKGDGYDFKSDIWSMGCLLYELAMLKSPFKSEGLNLYSLFQKISNGDYQPLPEHYSEDLRSLVYAMISTRPEERPELAYICTVAADMRAKYTEKYNLQKKTRSNSISEAKASQEESKTLENTVNIGDEKMDHIVNIVNKSRDVKNCNSEENVAVDEKDSAEEKKQDIGHDTYLPSRPIGDVKSTIFDENKNKPVNSYRRPRANNASNGYAKAGSTGHTEAIRRQNTELTVTNTIVGNNVDRENFEKQIHGSSVAFALMEVLYTKLVILGYPLDDPDRKGDKVGVDRIGRNKLLPFHFACNLQAFSGVAGHDNNHQFFQFRRMVQIVQWLCRKIGDASSLTIETFNLDEDSPITTAKQILRAVNVGYVLHVVCECIFSLLFCISMVEYLPSHLFYHR